MNKPTLSVSELFEQWRADNAIIAETPDGTRADTHIIGRIVETEAEIGTVAARTLGEIILKVRLLQSFRELRPESVETILTGLLADLDMLYRFADDIALDEGKGG